MRGGSAAARSICRRRRFFRTGRTPVSTHRLTDKLKHQYTSSAGGKRPTIKSAHPKGRAPMGSVCRIADSFLVSVAHCGPPFRFYIPNHKPSHKLAYPSHKLSHKLSHKPSHKPQNHLFFYNFARMYPCVKERNKQMFWLFFSKRHMRAEM